MRLLFTRSTGLGNAVAEPGQILNIEDGQARIFIASGRAVPAPGEIAPDTPKAITTESFGLNPETSASQRKKGHQP